MLASMPVKLFNPFSSGTKNERKAQSKVFRIEYRVGVFNRRKKNIENKRPVFWTRLFFRPKTGRKRKTFYNAPGRVFFK